MRILLLSGIAGPAIFSIVMIVSAAMQPGYSHLSNVISEMGANGEPYANFMNYAGFVPGGLLIAGFGVALGKVLPRHRRSIAGSMLVTLFGLGIVLSGVFSCDPGCPLKNCTVENFLHNLIAPVAFVCQIAGMVTLGSLFRQMPEWRSMWRYSICSGVIALIFLLGLASALESRVFIGLWQRLMLGTMFLWCGIVGWRAYCSFENMTNGYK